MNKSCYVALCITVLTCVFSCGVGCSRRESCARKDIAYFVLEVRDGKAKSCDVLVADLESRVNLTQQQKETLLRQVPGMLEANQKYAKGFLAYVEKYSLLETFIRIPSCGMSNSFPKELLESANAFDQSYKSFRGVYEECVVELRRLFPKDDFSIVFKSFDVWDEIFSKVVKLTREQASVLSYLRREVTEEELKKQRKQIDKEVARLKRLQEEWKSLMRPYLDVADEGMKRVFGINN